jgi:hypothetical protein
VNKRDRFIVEGLCWCDPETSLTQLRYMGHTEQCTAARRSWKANMQRMETINQQRLEDERVGREIRTSGGGG